MKVLRFICLAARRAHNSWALREIDPTHPDLPKLVIEQLQITDQLRKMFQ